MPTLPATRRNVMILSCTALAARGARAANPAAAPAPAHPVIAAAAPVSGDLALLGDENLRGIGLAADAVNAAGGLNGAPIALVTADMQDQADAGAAISGLIAQHAAVILGAGPSALSYSASAAAELGQTPYIELAAPADGIMARGFKFLARTAPTTTQIGRLAVASLQDPKYFVSPAALGGKRIGILFNTGATGGAIAAATLSALKAANLAPYLVSGYAENAADLYDVVGRLKRARIEILVHAAGPADVLAAFTAFSATGWRPPALLGCGDGYSLAETAIALGSAFDGTCFIAAPFYPPAAASVARAYLDKYGMKPRSPDSLSAYAGARLVFDVIGRSGTGGTAFFDHFRKISEPAGAAANGWGFSFDRDGQNTASFVTLQQWRGGVIVAR